MRGRKIFGGLEPYGRVWRAGANDATALHTDANLDIGGLSVPKGDYTLFVYLDPKQWQLVVSKATGEWGLDYDPRPRPGPSQDGDEQARPFHRNVQDDALERRREQSQAPTGVGKYGGRSPYYRKVTSS